MLVRKTIWQLKEYTGEYHILAHIPKGKYHPEIKFNDITNVLLEDPDPLVYRTFETEEEAKRILNLFSITATYMSSCVPYLNIRGYAIEGVVIEENNDGDIDWIESRGIDFAKFNIDDNIIYNWFKEMPYKTAERLVLTDESINEEYREFLRENNKDEQDWNTTDLEEFWESQGFETVR